MQVRDISVVHVVVYKMSCDYKWQLWDKSEKETEEIKILWLRPLIPWKPEQNKQH